MPKSFYIIDGHAQIYRAYFAPFRDLSSPSGEPTKATFVFTQRLMNLIADRKPDYLAMVIDSGDETVFRKEILPEYKANRQARPDDYATGAGSSIRATGLLPLVGIPIDYGCASARKALNLIISLQTNSYRARPGRRALYRQRGG